MTAHPDDMTMDELEALPVVTRVFRVVRSFVDSAGEVWDVGASAGMWSKSYNREPQPAVSAAKAVERA